MAGSSPPVGRGVCRGTSAGHARGKGTRVVRGNLEGGVRFGGRRGRAGLARCAGDGGGGPESGAESAAAAVGMAIDGEGRTTFRVWAPHAKAASIEMQGGRHHMLDPDESAPGFFAASSLPVGAGDIYRVALTVDEGTTLIRRDPYARTVVSTDDTWCAVDDGRAFDWAPWQRPDRASYSIYELHVGTYTPEGTLIAAAARLDHVKRCGFTAVQVLPVYDAPLPSWGRSPKQLFAVNPAYGTAADLRAFVDTAHRLGLAVIVDTVLHHGAPDLAGNALWDFDGWEYEANGGVYHEGGADNDFGREFAYWKAEVYRMVYDSCATLLADFRVDGLRFDAASALPFETAQKLTFELRAAFPDAFLTAEVTPEGPGGCLELGFDAVWVRGAYFDVLEEQRRAHFASDDSPHGGWDTARFRNVAGLYEGFERPCQAVKYLLGSHDQVGCALNGAEHDDHASVGGLHRYAVEQFGGGGRGDAAVLATQRLWWTANVCAAGVPLMFMGTETAQDGWWSHDRGLRWELAVDTVGREMIDFTAAANALRDELPVLRVGWPSALHEDPDNGVFAFERVLAGMERVVVVVNAGAGCWQEGEYGVFVGEGRFREVFSSQDARFGGPSGVHSNARSSVLGSSAGILSLSLPPLCALVFVQVYDDAGC